MPSRYFTYNSQLKISGSTGGHGGNAGPEPSIKQKQSWTNQYLPGKAADGFAAMKKGYKEISHYPAYNGLSKGKGGGNSNFIQKAIKHPGALTRQAKKAGQSPMAFAASHQDSPGVTGKRARLAMTLRKLNK